MPNHITNRLTIKGTPKQVLIVKEYIKDDELGIGTIDFNKIEKMPEDLDVTIHISLQKAAEYALKDKLSENPVLAAWEREARESCQSPLEFDDNEWEQFINLLNNRRKYGAYYWYDWCIENWGTKWNAYEQPDKRNTDDTIYFQTAWSCPFPIIKKLSTIFPDIEFEIAWADENLGYNLGIRIFKNGEIISEIKPKEGSKAAKELFFNITEFEPADYGMNENFEYIEE